MILDKENMFSYQQAITVTAASTNIIDLGPPFNQASGNDKHIPVGIFVAEPFTDVGDDASMTIALQSATAENFASPRTHWSRVFTLADLTTVGKPGGVSLMPNIPPDVRRYVRLNYTVADGPFTAGKLTAGVVASQQVNR